ncbi:MULTISPECIES: cysteine--tRNA ligase [unclassified Campylobacter]|uniref:cysteine--tRNA ligase n=1 Tax=unclassified Campylobacter TaxID=2593542 RepID=UPI001237D224|nr:MULTISPECIES: cysteine--tRNA ligase [unclassified Campylobacter]KAA6225356.1 cysteine--tRNA ligase [Campylobacter sp. LR185c]KAA6227052.1 cysteine--tRNA ligase [Campylobacter sp. LR196d]KAA6227623.1 cysteine--tRNA ligase [Campylobacter sp. LR286c]KAA8604952.1 cysteine--tRNA ligase [Campylobacter sp. LR185c]
MRLFDSVSKEKINLNQKEVNIYLCGPTVYDLSHLGHGRSSVCFDLLHRVLLALNYKVNFVRNYTDIDDKILNKMQESNKSLEEITELYIKKYESDMASLRILEPSKKPRATHFIRQMLELIKDLDKRGFVYKLQDGIYFDTSKDKAYLSLSKKPLDNTKTRLEQEVSKKNPSDFVLWKFDENFYESEYGKGRPGWHSECVAMILGIFKNTLDIHAGGADLFFPHHENEAAQCRCAYDKNLAKIWLHNGFVNINGEKMSKSLNNSFFIEDALKSNLGEVLRLYLLSVHYRGHFNYSLQDLELSKKRLDKIYRLKKRLELKELEDFPIHSNFKSQISQNILEVLQDDLNISKALALLDDFIINANLSLDKNQKDIKEKLQDEFKEVAKIFGLGFLDPVFYFQHGVSKEEIKCIEEQILQRKLAKENKEYTKADLIRDNLKQRGILLLDTKNGTIWEKDNV